IDWLALRVDSLIALGDLAAAADAVAAMKAVAERANDAGLEARARCCEVEVKVRRGDTTVRDTATAAVAAARRSGEPALEAAALACLASAKLRTRSDFDGAVEDATHAAERFEALGRELDRGRALRLRASAWAALGRAAESNRDAYAALEIAQRGGDLLGQADALNAINETDIAQRMKRLTEALALFRAAGQLSGEAIVANNLGNCYSQLGLNRRARRQYLHAMAISQRIGAASGTRVQAWNLALVEAELGRAAEAAARAADWQASFGPRLPAGAEPFAAYLKGHLALLDGRTAEGARDIERAVRQSAGTDVPGRLMFLTEAAHARLALGKARAALAASRRAVALHASIGGGPLVEMEISELWWRHHQALIANGRDAEAATALRQAYRFVVDRVASVSDEGLRRSFLDQWSVTRAIVSAWIAHARSAGLPRAEREAHLAGGADFRQPFERLVDTGLRLNEVRSAAELHEFLVDEATELSGAQRVLLVLDAPAGFSVAAAQLPRGEDEGALLAAITPWLEEARRTRAVALRHGPADAEPIDQRSCLVAPLIAQQALIGYLYADLDGAFGRFHDADRDLLALLASQAAVALANARFNDGLERTVAERTAQLEQRAGELALINSIQQGIASKLEFQAIIDLVGSKLGEVFGTGDLSIRWWDDRANTVQMLYGVEHGRRLPEEPPVAVKPGSPRDQLLRTGVGGYRGSHAEQVAVGIRAAPGTDWALSLLAAPVRGTQRVLGQITLENHEREHAFGEADLRVLTTIGATLGVALENARLFDETQRLLKETEQRNAELAVINSIQQGIAGSLDFQAISNLVGDKLCALLKLDDLGIRWLDPDGETLRYLYAREDGQRIEVAPHRAGPLARRTLETRQPMVLNVADRRALGSKPVPGTREGLSTAMVPIVAGERALGILDSDNYVRENAFGEAEVRLLQTVASAMGVALENARL
ncbi:MAG TPA: GAF domain-containing protein, partial [Burkholderiaceae bacterium]|nr:GAF domain-containing protein [Burkholderiaceae bacterium]